MPLTLGAILMSIATALVVRVLFAFGVGILTYVGAETLISDAESWVLNAYSGMPETVISLANLAGVDECIKILFASATAYVGLRVLMGVYKKLGFLPG